MVGAQSTLPCENNNQYPYAKFIPSMAIIIVVLIGALFFMSFFSIYIRHWSDIFGTVGSVHRALSLRSRHAAAAHGLDASILKTFPTFHTNRLYNVLIPIFSICVQCLDWRVM
ncbi:E3 ubiquitin-protein ligase [Forsythia ovata]|uniref:E3 ubiquitin-protein ligase n=1 Tax=Forsythia ovata TaxID=205694 RepID=A0ABD1P2J7_9LAMI